MGDIYYEEYLKKEDNKGRWQKSWVQLKAKGLFFYNEKVDLGNLNEIIEISESAKCVLAKRRMYSFRFKLYTEKGAYLLKCDSVLNRNRWMNVIELASKGKVAECPPCFAAPAPIDAAAPREARNSASRELFFSPRRLPPTKEKEQEEKESKQHMCNKRGKFPFVCIILPWTFICHRKPSRVACGSFQCLVEPEFKRRSSNEPSNNADNFGFCVD